MTRGLLLGILGTFAFGWLVQVLIPQAQLGDLQPQVNEETGEVYPVDKGGFAMAGQAVYAANGCAYCHTQQVRSEYMGADLERNWGARRTVARDYIYDPWAFVGTMRIGPDLANVGKRLNDPMWHYKHLYNPRWVVPGSIMPAFTWLFEERKVVGDIPVNAVGFTKDGKVIVPTSDAEYLVSYLLSLDKEHALAEAKLKAKPAEAPTK